jgi:HSP20 family protein
MSSLMPWKEMSSMREQMDRLFDRFLDLRWGELPAFGEWVPRLDLSETKDSVIVKAEIPGMDPKDVEVSLQENVLTIRGEKKQEKEEKDERHHRVERRYGAFTRSTRLPVTVDDKKVEAKFKSGVLTVTLAKAPGAKSSAIPIKAE